MIILREGKEPPWKYTIKGQEVKDPVILEYISKLVIPPAYRNVEIYYTKKPKILYMGIDAKDRPQFIYAPWWAEQQREIKLCNLIAFGEKLPQIMNDIKGHLEAKRWTMNKIVSLILRIISFCYFRVGNIKYETLYESHGITTITDKHLKFDQGGAHISFVGKKGVLNECVVVDPLTVKLLKELSYIERKSDDKHLFRYQSEGQWHHIKHTDINDFLKVYDPTFTSKMFRTFDTNIMLIKILGRASPPDKPTARKKEVVKALKEVSLLVHNTPAICKKDYADPELLKMYLEHPRTWTKWFVTPPLTERTKLINYLRSKCDF